jgi:protein TonB
MAYVDQTTQTNRNKAIIGVVAIHAAIGYVLVSGMAVDFIETVTMPNPTATPIYKLPPPLPPKPEPQPKQNEYTEPVSRPIYTPPTTLAINPNPIPLDTTKLVLPPFESIAPMLGSSGFLKPIPSATTPSFTPVGAKARNNSGDWVTTNDYRSSWINREMIGTAGFEVKVGTNGRAQSCLITRSSGHDALDKATCDLIRKRARFEPAKNSQGEKVGGTYASSVRWQLPE